MKPIKLLLAATLLAALGVGDAAAHGGGHRHFHRGAHFGFFVGPFWGPWYRPYDYPPVVVEQAPPVYIERDPESAAASGHWYYCNGARGYYPYVKECPGGWLKVPPQPADPR